MCMYYSKNNVPTCLANTADEIEDDVDHGRIA